MIDKSQWPERVRLADFPKLIGVQISTMQRRTMCDYFAKRYRDAHGFYWLRDELEGKMIRPANKAVPCEKCGGSMWAKGDAWDKKHRYFSCSAGCGHSIKQNMESGEYSAVVAKENKFPPCPDCGNVILHISRSAVSLGGKCKGCGTNFRLSGDGHLYRRSEKVAKPKIEKPKKEPKPKVAKAVKQKIETPAKKEVKQMAKSASGNAREAREAIQRKHIQGIVKPEVDKNAAAKRQALRDAEYRLELRRIERDFMGY